MRNIPIRFKMLFWYAVALVIIVAITIVSMLIMNKYVVEDTAKVKLIAMVENKTKYVEYTSKADVSEKNRFYIKNQEGYMKIYEAFTDDLHNVYMSLYDSNANFLYGTDITRGKGIETELIPELHEIKIKGKRYYAYDKKLDADNLKGIWIRGVIPEDALEIETLGMIKNLFWFLPLIVVLAICGGFFISKKSLAPIEKINANVLSIKESGDLKQRINIGKGTDEIHVLADSFNSMFESLEKSFEKQKQFTSDVSHELRTPMSVINAESEYILEKEAVSKAEYKEAFEVVHRQSKKMNVLINDMLDYTRLDMQTDCYELTRCNLSEIVFEVCRDLKDMYQKSEKEIALKTQIQENVYAKVNRQLFERALINLISNAFKYGKENGYIDVNLHTQADKIMLHIKDNGVGIEEKNIEKIFDRFFQENKSRAGEGNGLGLAITKKIVQCHEGQLTVQSESNIGSEFTIVLNMDMDK